MFTTRQLHTRRLRALAAIGLSFLSVALSARAAQAAPSDPDPSFGKNGAVTIDAGGYEDLLDLARQPDGKLVGVGSTSNGYDRLVFRLGPDGKPDRSFGSDGLVKLDRGGNETGNGVAIQPDGKIVVVGDTSNGDGNVEITRLNSDGSPDKGFGFLQDGVLTLNSGGLDLLFDVTLGPGGKIFTSGMSQDHGVVYWLKPTGTVDNAKDLYAGPADRGEAVAVQPDGKILIAGYTNKNDDLVVWRLNPQGDPDKDFAAGGVFTLDLGGFDSAEDVVVQPDGKIDLAGHGSRTNDAIVVRLTPTGSLDKGFGRDGVASVDTGGLEEFVRVALQPDGKIVAAGGTSKGQDALVARLNADGSPDTTFAPDGIFATSRGGLEEANALALQPDGRILLGGNDSTSDGNALVLRLLGDEPDTGGGAGRGPGVSGGPGPGSGNGSRPDSRTTFCAGKRATIVGTARRDVIRGTKRRDVIAGLGGNDVIRGLAGNDLIRGLAGNDRLIGGRGRDRLIGGPGRDTVRQ